MTHKSNKTFINEIYSKSPQKNFATNKTDVYHFDDIWSSENSDLKEYKSEKNRGYRYVLAVIDNFSKLGWTDPLKNENSITIKDSFENIRISSQKKPNLIESDGGKEIYNNIFQNFLNDNNIKIYSKNTSLEAVFAEKFNQTIGDLLERPVFEQGDSNWIHVLPTITKQYNKGKFSSTKLTPIQASLKKWGIRVQKFIR